MYIINGVHVTKKQPPRAVREPVQVYLDVPDRATLDRAAAATGLPRAEVLRRGLRRFAAELLADESPALAFLEATAEATANAPLPTQVFDIAARHDDYLADSEIASWSEGPMKAAGSVKYPKPKRR